MPTQKEVDPFRYLKQRSKGVRWFLSLYLQLKASAIDNVDSKKQLIFLIDEPGASLHARAQADTIKVFDEIVEKSIQIIFTTHSPYFINVDTIYRILAVQRNEDDDESDTRIFNTHELGAASTDTLSPLYKIMGVDFSHQNVIKKDNNVILEEISAFYYLRSFWLLNNVGRELNFLPATGTSNIEQLVYLFLGWDLDFIVIVDDETSGRKVYNKLKRNLYEDEEDKASKKIIKLKGYKCFEEIFSIFDFKKYVLCDDTAIIESSIFDYLKKEKIAKGIVSLKFLNKVKDKEIKFDSFDTESKNNIKELIEKINKLLPKEVKRPS